MASPPRTATTAKVFFSLSAPDKSAEVRAHMLIAYDEVTKNGHYLQAAMESVEKSFIRDAPKHIVSHMCAMTGLDDQDPPPANLLSDYIRTAIDQVTGSLKRLIDCSADVI